jgi:hypothetical protein
MITKAFGADSMSHHIQHISDEVPRILRECMHGKKCFPPASAGCIPFSLAVLANMEIDIR